MEFKLTLTVQYEAKRAVEELSMGNDVKKTVFNLQKSLKVHAV